MIICPVCFRHCKLKEGQLGFCKARRCLDGISTIDHYGAITSLNLDPIEKKPLKQFFPGCKILSIGSYGCNLRCPFCQNYEISIECQPNDYDSLSSIEIVDKALAYIDQGNIGIAFTYNEPLVSYEFVLKTFKLAKSKGLKTVLVTNGEVTLPVLEEIIPYVDAMNVDLKAFSSIAYQRVGGDFQTVKDFITYAAKRCHVEVTTLVVPGINDSEKDFTNEVIFLSSISKELPLHLTRYFPNYIYKEKMTPLSLLIKYQEIAKKYLNFVYVGNV